MKILTVITTSLFLYLLLISNSYGQLCKNWGQPITLGALDHKIIAEASGIAVSHLGNNRLYHVNDSGNGSYFYSTYMDGSNTKSISIKGFDSSKADFEDMTIGPCYLKTCLFIGDIGDNNKTRDHIKILVIEEKENYKSNVKPIKIVKLVYPDRPHDAEALAVHPNGDLYILTKEANYKRHKSFPAKLFKIEREKWENSTSDLLMLDLIGTVNIESINKTSTGFFDNIITSFDIASNGIKFVILTYQNAYEFNIDLSKSNTNTFNILLEDKGFKVVELKRLPQQESITYLPDSKSLIYNSEYIGIKPKLVQINCLE